jgi:hypothetical protein
MAATIVMVAFLDAVPDLLVAVSVYVMVTRGATDIDV